MTLHRVPTVRELTAALYFITTPHHAGVPIRVHAWQVESSRFISSISGWVIAEGEATLLWGAPQFKDLSSSALRLDPRYVFAASLVVGDSTGVLFICSGSASWTFSSPTGNMPNPAWGDSLHRAMLAKDHAALLMRMYRLFENCQHEPKDL